MARNGPEAVCLPPALRLQTWSGLSSSSSPDPSGAPLFCRSRRRRMSTQILDALSRLAARRFGSFADAATDVLDLLESASPGGSVALGQVDWDEGSCRMIDARGDAVPRGSVIPLARGVPDTGSAAGDLLDGDSLAALGPANWVAAPLDAADGRVIGVLLAGGADGATPSHEVAQLLLVGARLLSYE